MAEAKVRVRGEEIRRFLLENVEQHPSDAAKLASDHFKITRQAVHKHVRRLISERALTEEGQTRNRVYKLAPLIEWRQIYHISPELAEDVIWRKDISSILGKQPQNVSEIWQHGFTEIFNNAKDHSQGSSIIVVIKKTAITTAISIIDNGVGIFRKIKEAMNLLDERHAILELAKGKLTTDPKRHSGEGIFFTSRMFDSFWILSIGASFRHDFGRAEEWIFEEGIDEGTHVKMVLNNHTARRKEKIFNQYATGDGFTFNKTVVPVRLAQYGNEQLISRSQAKRLLTRVELFNIVLFDFKEVPTIGQAFADEIFRVFATEHPEINLLPININSEVRRMISRVRSPLGQPSESTPTSGPS